MAQKVPAFDLAITSLLFLGTGRVVGAGKGTEQLLGFVFIKHVQKFYLFCGRNRGKHICSIFLEIYFEIQIWGDFKIVIGCTVVLTLRCAPELHRELIKA